VANIKGTNGNDSLVGTPSDDQFRPLLGQDFVDGGTGWDTLVVDYSAGPGAYYSESSISSAGGSFEGGVAGASGTVSFVR